MFLKIELNSEQIDLIPLSEDLVPCDGCYGLIEFCYKSWGLDKDESIDLVREWTDELLRQIKEGATIASHDIFTGVIVDE